MWLFSSRVVGSTSWNSSSIPIVNFSGMGVNGRIVAGRSLPALIAWLLAAPALAQEARGPIELREEWLLAQNRLTLPAIAPDVLPAGTARLRLSLDWGNDFGWQQDVRGEEPEDRRYMVDGEHRTLALELRRGLGRGVEAGARLPLRWRGGGMLDGVIDAFHEFTLRLGLPDNQRSFFATDRFRVDGTDRAGNGVSWEAATGSGLGNLELSARWAAAGHAPGTRLALVGRLGLPTGTGPFDADGLEAGVQAVTAVRLADRLDLYAGLGGTAFSDTEVGGLEYSRLRGCRVRRARVARDAAAQPARGVQRREPVDQQPGGLSRGSSPISGSARPWTCPAACAWKPASARTWRTSRRPRTSACSRG